MLTRRTALALGTSSILSVIASAPLFGCSQAPAQDDAQDAGQTEAASVDGAWYEDVPRESWAQFQKVETSDPWFSVYELPGNVYAIDEDSQWEEIISYLIVGEERAILFDTGMGISSIRATVDELIDLPVTVVLSHTHHDHMGGMHEFDELLVFDSPESVERATSGEDEFGDISYEVEEEALNPARALPEGFDPEGFRVIGKAPTGTLAAGDVIDLGGRTLRVMETPGHTADGIMLVDEAAGIILTGDAYYPAELYAYNEEADLATYAQTMHEVANEAEELGLEWIYPGHNETVHGVGILAEVADDMDTILDGSAQDFEIGDDGYRYYSFPNDVVIITEDVDFE